MGCHGQQAAPLHHDQHLPDQHGAAAGASAGAPAARQARADPHPDSAYIARLQQATSAIFGLCGDPALVSVCRRISIPVLQ